MKRIFIFLILFNLTNQIIHAQVAQQKKYIIFKTKVIDIHNIIHKGFLVTIDDSTLYLAHKKYTLTFAYVDLDGFDKFSCSEIRKIILHKKGGIKSGMIAGGQVGATVGVVIGLAQPYQNGLTNQISRAGTGIVLALAGGAIGGLIGAPVGTLSHKVFHINGSKDKLDEMHDKMIDLLY